MAGMQFADINEFKSYILRSLGSPVINVEIHDDQLTDIIFDSVQDFCRYQYDEGSYADYLPFTLSAGVSAYSLSGSDIEDVFDLILSTGPDGINTLFSPANMLLGSDLAGLGGIPGVGGGESNTQGSGLAISNYQIALMYIEEIKNAFGKAYRVEYRPISQNLIIVPTPQVDSIGLLSVYRNEKAIYLYSHPLVKKLAVARAKIRWGMHLKKYSLALPGGGTIDGQSVYNEGKEDEVAIMEQIVGESEPPDFFIA